MTFWMREASVLVYTSVLLLAFSTVSASTVHISPLKSKPTIRSFTSTIADYTSMAIGADNLPIMVYHDNAFEKLKFVKCTDSTCATKVTGTIDNTVWTGRFVSLAIGSDGLPVMSYYDFTGTHLKFARCNDYACSSPTVSTIDSNFNVGQYSSIAIGRDGLPVISYYDFSNGLRFAKCNDLACSSPSTGIIDGSFSTGLYTSITIGADGYPVVAYYDNSNHDLHFLKCNDASCSSTSGTNLDSTGDVGLYTSVAIGRDGYPVVTYYDNTNHDLKFVKCTNASCSSSAVSTLDSGGDVGQYTSVKIGSDGYPIISYFDVTNSQLKFIKCANASCSSYGTRSIEASDGYTSIALARDQYPVIAHPRAANVHFVYLGEAVLSTSKAGRGNGPTPKTLDSTGDSGGSTYLDTTAVAQGSDGFPILAYYAYSTQDLKFIKCNDFSCNSTTIRTLDSTGDVGSYASIVAGTDGYPVMSYYDGTNGHLKYAKCNDISCSSPTISTVDGGTQVGLYSSIAIGRDGFPVIGYYDSNAKRPKFLKCNDAACSSPAIVTLEVSDNIGYNTSLAIGRDGYPVMSYIDFSNGVAWQLRFLKCNDSACASTTIRALGGATAHAGSYTSIAIGADGYPIITYRDVDTTSLKLAKCTDTSCSSPTYYTLDSSSNVAWFSSVTKGIDGLPMASYYDITNQDLKFVKCNNTSCSSKNVFTLDSSGATGQNTSIAIDGDGFPIISYHDVTNGSLRFIHCGAYCGSKNTVGKTQSTFISSGLVGYWSFNGKDMDWRTSKAIDRSGQSHDGILLNMSTTTTPKQGKIGQALKFDGADDYIVPSYGGGLVYNASSPHESVAFWVKAPSQNTHYIYTETGNSGGEGFYMRSGPPPDCCTGDKGDRLEMIINLSNFTNILGMWTNASVFDNTWHHVVWTDNNGVAKIYVDGSPDSANFNYTPNSTMSLLRTGIGAGLYGGSPSGYFNGTFDEFRVYNRALTAQEVRNLYLAGR